MFNVIDKARTAGNALNNYGQCVQDPYQMPQNCAQQQCPQPSLLELLLSRAQEVDFRINSLLNRERLLADRLCGPVPEPKEVGCVNPVATELPLVARLELVLTNALTTLDSASAAMERLEKL